MEIISVTVDGVPVHFVLRDDTLVLDGALSNSEVKIQFASSTGKCGFHTRTIKYKRNRRLKRQLPYPRKASGHY